MGRKRKDPRAVWHKRNECYVAVYYDEQGRRRQTSLGTADYEEAQKRLTAFREEGLTHDGWTVGMVLDYYEREHVPNTASPDTARMNLRRLYPHYSLLPVTDMDATVNREYVEARRRGEWGQRKPKDSTIRKEQACLVAALNFAKKYDKIPKVPHVELVGKYLRKNRVLSQSERDRMMKYARRQRDNPSANFGSGLNAAGNPRWTRLERFLLIAFATGQRQSAILELTWDQVNFEENYIQFNPEGRQQTKKYRPKVPMNESLRQGLRLVYAERRPGSPWVLDLEPKRKGLRTTWRNMVDTLELEGVTPHTIRHTVCTRLADVMHPVDAAAIVGMDVTTYLSVYCKEDFGRMKKGVDYLGSLVQRKPSTL